MLVFLSDLFSFVFGQYVSLPCNECFLCHRWRCVPQSISENTYYTYFVLIVLHINSHQLCFLTRSLRVILSDSEQWDCMSAKIREQLQRSLSTLQSDSRPDLRDKAQELRRRIQSQPWGSQKDRTVERSIVLIKNTFDQQQTFVL